MRRRIRRRWFSDQRRPEFRSIRAQLATHHGPVFDMWRTFRHLDDLFGETDERRRTSIGQPCDPGPDLDGAVPF